MAKKKEYADLKKFKKNQLQEGEEIITWGGGYIGKMMGSGDDTQHNGVLVVTNRRSVFYKKGMFSEVFEEIMHSKVSSVFSKKVLGHTTLTIHTSGNDLEFKSLVPDEAKDLQNTINELKGGGQLEQAKLQPQDSPIEQIEKLASLKEKGILTQEEFDVKKSELLAKVA